MMSDSAELLDHLLEAVGTVACAAQSPHHRAAAQKAMGEALEILQAAPIAPLSAVTNQETTATPLLESGWHIRVVKGLPNQSLVENDKKQP
jgi:polysaccharide deacetylase 2 family uncharacterized protein YibQ